MALTPKKRAFIDALRGGASNRDAAIAAGCPEKTASAAGSRLAKDPDVIRELHKLNALFPISADVKADVKTDVKPARPKAAPRAPKPACEYVEKVLQSPELADDGSLADPGPSRVYTDPKDYLLDDMNDPKLDRKDRRDAAKALMPFLHARKGEGGKKEQAKEKAAQAGAGLFGTRRGPLQSVK